MVEKSLGRKRLPGFARIAGRRCVVRVVRSYYRDAPARFPVSGWITDAMVRRALSDRSARRIRDGLRFRIGVEVAVIISDTFGRPWRRGLTDVAIGVAGIAAVVDLRGTEDTKGRILQVTEVCVADELAGAAEMVMGKASGVAAAVVRGVEPAWLGEGSVAGQVVRHPSEDLFR